MARITKYSGVFCFAILFAANINDAFAQIKYKNGSPITIGTATATVVRVDAGLFSVDGMNEDGTTIITDDLVGVSLILPSKKSSISLINKSSLISSNSWQTVYKILSRPNSYVNIQYRPQNDFNNSSDAFFNLRNNFGDIIKVSLGNDATSNIVFFGKDGVGNFVINPEFLIDPKKSQGNYKADYYLVASY